MSEQRRVDCPDCEEGVSRRDFVKKVTGIAIAGSLLPAATAPRRAVAAPNAKSTAETAVKRFYDSLKDEQKKQICFPFDHDLRKKINANWAITKPKIDDYSKEQQGLLDEIFKSVTSPEGYERFQKQMEDDAGGFGEYQVAVQKNPRLAKAYYDMGLLYSQDKKNAEAKAAFEKYLQYGTNEDAASRADAQERLKTFKK